MKVYTLIGIGYGDTSIFEPKVFVYEEAARKALKDAFVRELKYFIDNFKTIEYLENDDYAYCFGNEDYCVKLLLSATDVVNDAEDNGIELVEEKENRESFAGLMDAEGKEYKEDESFPAGGGLDRRCTYNGDALYCFYCLTKYTSICDYLVRTGWIQAYLNANMECWEKGDTRICFEILDCSDFYGGQWGYMHTEYIG